MHKELLTAVKVLTCPKPCTVSKGFQDGNRQLWPKSQRSLVPSRPHQGHWTASDSDRLCAGQHCNHGGSFSLWVNCWHISSTKYYRCWWIPIMPASKIENMTSVLYIKLLQLQPIRKYLIFNALLYGAGQRNLTVGGSRMKQNKMPHCGLLVQINKEEIAFIACSFIQSHLVRTWCERERYEPTATPGHVDAVLADFITQD